MNLNNKEEFLKEFGHIYGYPNAPRNIDQIRDSEFNNRLQGVVYLDHAGATLYSESQLEAVFKDLSTNLYGNPHSRSNSSSNIDNIVDNARRQVLDYCNASPKDYKCIFTSGATAGFKLIGESFPWSSQSSFMYTLENHNSVLGIREYALNQGASAFAIDMDEMESNGGEMGDSASVKVTQHPPQRRKEARCLEEETTGNTYSLFAFPSECNFSGVRYSLDLVKIMKENANSILGRPPACKERWIVMVDAAKGCSTKPPDLSKYHADFVAISFYKLFGYPTGLGALLVHNDAVKLLKKTYFSGGTVAASIADLDFVKKRDGFEELFEDGTISFLGIASLTHGFKILNTLSCSAISSHTKLLSAYTRKILSSLRHDNGTVVCTLYGINKSKVPFDGLGSVISFNLKRRDGSWVGYGEVEKLASLSAIKLRTGCFCNPGACAKYLGLSHFDLLSNIEAGHVCWDDYDIVRGKPTGAVRISFGYMSTFEDIKKFIEFVVTHFVSLPHKSGLADLSRGLEITSGRSFFLKSIFVYPIKSCAGFSSDSWPLSSTGLLYDREWLLKSPSGEILTQKKVPEMRLISTYIDNKTETMTVESPRCKTKLLVNLSLDAYNGESEEINLLAHRYRVQGYTENINTWFSTAIGRPCSLLRCSYSDYFYFTGNCENDGTCRDVEGRLNFVNEAQLLLVSEESIRDLNNKLCLNAKRSSRGSAIQVNPSRFRPNLVISGGESYAEDSWENLKIGNNYFTSLGGCNRCQMINFDHQEGQVQKSNEPLLTLASYRRVKGKILFGILLRYDNGVQLEKDSDSSWLHIGDELQTHLG